MPSAVFTPKKRFVDFTYADKNGDEVTLRAYSLTSKEHEEIAKAQVDETDSYARIKLSIKKRLKDAEDTTCNAVIEDVYENGDLVEFLNFLDNLVVEAKKQK